MPTRRLSLSRAELGRHRSAAQELCALGLDVEVERPDDLDIGAGPPWENMLFDVRSGGVAYYAVWLRMVARRSRVILTDYEMTTDWDDQILLLNIDERKPFCKLGSLEFEGREVLNSRLENHLRFYDQGAMVEGWLLASGLRPIPPQYRYGQTLPCQLTFWDQFHHEIGVRAYLSVLRRGTQQKVAERPRVGLFDLAENQKLHQVSVTQKPSAPVTGGQSLWEKTPTDAERVERK
jgi:hypothetical protein